MRTRALLSGGGGWGGSGRQKWKCGKPTPSPSVVGSALQESTVMQGVELANRDFCAEAE